MWKRDEGVRAPQGPVTPATPPTSGAPAAQAPVVDAPASPSRPLAQPMRDVVNIGKSVVIKGELNGSEDLTIEGQVEGKIELRQNVLTIGPNGKVQDAKVLRSIPLLDQAALEAVKQWEFTPTLLNGVPVPVIMTVTVNFTLQ